MKGLNWIIIILAIITIILGVIIYLDYQEKNNLNSIIAGLEIERDSLIQENMNLVLKNNNLQGEYDLLNQDVANIYKTCITENACKGHYPGVSWYCNNVGDSVIELATASHLCKCDSVCALNATQIKNIEN